MWLNNKNIAMILYKNSEKELVSGTGTTCTGVYKTLTENQFPSPCKNNNENIVTFEEYTQLKTSDQF